MGRTAIVTGSSRGIGKSIALRLAQDGYDVCVNDVAANKQGIDETVAEIEKLGRKAVGVVADVTKRAEVDAMVKESVAKLGPLNTMVANAGIAQVKLLLDLTEEDMETMFAVNLYGVHNCYSAAARQFIAQGRPPQSPDDKKTAFAGVYKIIGAASIAAFKPFPLLGHYSASKFAVRGLTQAYAMEMAAHGITVNAYAPGLVGTAMWDLIDEKMGELEGAARGDMLKKYSDQLILLKRTSVPDDIGNLVHFLASPDSDYVTGQTMICDGGICFG